MSTVVNKEPLCISSSHLALRFYKPTWTKELLDQYVTRGRVKDQAEGQKVRDYWFLDHTLRSQMDMEKLYRELKPRVFHWDDRELFGDDAIDYMKKMNW